MPFVLHSQPTAAYDERGDLLTEMATTAHRRYAEIMRDVQGLINDHSRQASWLKPRRKINSHTFIVAHQQKGTHGRSKLKLLVPSVGIFFTPLPLEDAFVYQDRQRFISSRRFVPPSFNDIRLVLNTAQAMGLVRERRIRLVTFDGDVTLYDDGESLLGSNSVIPRILRLLRSGTKVGIVTAAGYTDASKYYERLHGLLDAVASAIHQGDAANPELIVLGGESNYLFEFDITCPHRLQYIPRDHWMLDEMKLWTEEDVTALLDVAEGALRECIKNMHLQADILRKERAVGIVPSAGGQRFAREQLEETVLVTQQVLEMSAVGKRLPFCAFNGTAILLNTSERVADSPLPGGSDVFVDIGDKSWGVRACQRFFGGIDGSMTLHVGDQFLSAGANDFKVGPLPTTKMEVC